MHHQHRRKSLNPLAKSSTRRTMDSKKDERGGRRTIREMDRAEILTQSRAEVHQDLKSSAAADAPIADKPQTKGKTEIL